MRDMHAPQNAPDPRNERVFPAIEGRQNSYQAFLVADGRVAVGLLGAEALDGGKRIFTAYDLSGLYPSARIAMLQYPENGKEHTSFLYPSDRQLFDILYSTLIESGFVINMRILNDAGAGTGLTLRAALELLNSGKNPEAVTHMDFDGVLTHGVLAKLIEHLNNPPVLTMHPFPAEMKLPKTWGTISKSYPQRN